MTDTELGLVELDLLATHAGVSVPFPLQAPVFGRIAGEREVLLAAAGETLQARGLADADGPLGLAADLVTALRQYRGAVDLVLVGRDSMIGVVAMVHGSSALLCVQSTAADAEEPGTVRVRRVAPTALADELVAMVPEVAAVVSMPITLPPGVVRQADPEQESADDGVVERRLRDLVRDRGGDPAVLDQLAALLPTLSGRGQLGATRRDEEDEVTRAGTELSWLDGPQGRVMVSRTDDGWVSVNPLRPTDLRFALDRFAMTARSSR
jgi:hypothetical protein